MKSRSHDWDTCAVQGLQSSAKAQGHSSQPARLFVNGDWATIAGHMKPTDNRVVRLIALFKLVEAVLLIVVGMSALHLLHKDVASVAEHWVKVLGLDPGNRYIDRALQKAGDLTPNKIRGLGIGSFIYAGLFLTQGIGLWLVKRWAEWFSVIITSSLVPVEVYEIHRHPSALKVLVLILNIAVVAYLIYRIRNETPSMSDPQG
jgi:uncharacterized membrane protein (DUF2068 family)